MTPARCRKVKEVGQGFAPKLATEAPVNGGRNYDGPKVNFVSLSKTWLCAGNPEYPTLLVHRFARRVGQ
jgi:hypothetical protein